MKDVSIERCLVGRHEFGQAQEPCNFGPDVGKNEGWLRTSCQVMP
jgi:hypothetical protein